MSPEIQPEIPGLIPEPADVTQATPEDNAPIQVSTEVLRDPKPQSPEIEKRKQKKSKKGWIYSWDYRAQKTRRIWGDLPKPVDPTVPPEEPPDSNLLTKEELEKKQEETAQHNLSLYPYNQDNKD